MENFKQFCINITNTNIPNIHIEAADCYLENDELIEHVTADIKNKLDIIDHVSVPYIEGKFDNLDAVGDILAFTKHEDIPDALLNLISYKVYDKEFNLLSNAERSIIAVLSVYILIYNFRGGFFS